MPSGVVIYGVEDTLAAVLEIRKSSRGEICWLVPPSLLALSLDYNILRLAKQFTEESGVIRGITTVMPTNLDTVRAELDIGEDVRHTDSLSSELFMYIGDRQHSISSINVGVKEYTHDTALTCFKSSDPTYAEYLLTSFESAWSQAVPAKERIQALAREAGQR